MPGGPVCFILDDGQTLCLSRTGLVRPRFVHIREADGEPTVQLEVVDRAVLPGEDRRRNRAYLPHMGSGRRGTAHQQAQGGAVPDPVILEFRYRPPDRATNSATDGADEEDVPKAELARRLNASIYKAGRSLAGGGDEEFELTFFCACGCMTEVQRSLREYVIRGAVVNGHSRPAEIPPPLDLHDD